MGDRHRSGILAFISLIVSSVSQKGGISLILLVYLLPVSCFLFVNSLVSIIEKVHKDDKNIGFNTIGATFGLLLIIGAILVPQFLH